MSKVNFKLWKVQFDFAGVVEQHGMLSKILEEDLSEDIIQDLELSEILVAYIEELTEKHRPDLIKEILDKCKNKQPELFEEIEGDFADFDDTYLIDENFLVNDSDSYEAIDVEIYDNIGDVDLNCKGKDKNKIGFWSRIIPFMKKKNDIFYSPKNERGVI